MRRSSGARTAAFAAAALFGAAGACKPEPAIPKRAGRLLAQGSARRMLVSPDLQSAAFLLDAKEAKAQGAPEGVFAGTLATARLTGGPAARRLGEGVTDLDGGFLFSPDGKRLAWLSGYRFREGRGDLHLAEASGGEPRALAERVSFFAFEHAGARLYWIDGADNLGADPALPKGPPAQARSFETRPDDGALLIKDKSGRLLLGSAELAARAGHYAFSPDSRHLAWEARSATGASEALYLASAEPGGPGAARAARRKVADGATDFEFSPDGARLAFLSVPADEGASFGDLYLAEVGTEAKPIRVGERVAGFRFAAGGAAGGGGALALLAKYDHRSRSGNLVVAVPGAPPADLGPGVVSFDFSPSGAYVAYLQRVLKPIFTQELWVARTAAEPAPRRVEQGVYGLQFAAGDALLGFKARCRNNASSCTLFTVNPAGGEPRERAKDVAGFDFAPDGRRVLVMKPFRGASTSAVEVWVFPSTGGEGLLLADAATPSARWVDAGRVLYSAPPFAPSPGVYLADLP